MAKGSMTRKKHMSKGMSIPKHAATMQGINQWYVSMFEKFGWMLLAKEKGMEYKIEPYKKSIDNLLKTIDHVKGEYEDHNRKHDLGVLRMHVEVLKKHAAML